MILLDYDPIRAPTNPMMLKYFYKDIWPSILAKLQNKDLKPKSFVQIVKKAVVVEDKANLRPWATICNIDQNCP